MRLTSRFVTGALLITGALASLLIITGDARQRRLAVSTERRRLEREATFIASVWNDRPAAPDSLARAGATALDAHIILIRLDGTRAADSDLPLGTTPDAEQYGNRPEIATALAGKSGFAERPGSDGGALRLHVAVPGPRGVVRLDRRVRDVIADLDASLRLALLASALALLLAGGVAYAIAADTAQRLTGLRDVARALAGGELERRPALAAPGEVGELASALHRLAEALSDRVAAHAAEDALVDATLDALHEGVAAVDARSNIVRINATARRLLAVQDPLPFHTDRLPRDRALRDALTAALSGGTADLVETTIGDRTLSIAARPLVAGGAVIAVLDLTTQRRLETMRRDFVANVSHELKTPITVIGGFAETLLDPDLPAASRQQFAETIRSHAQRMHRLVDDLLDLSRIESGGWIPNPAEADLSALAAEASAVAAAAADERGITLDIEIARGAGRPWADPTALRQIIANLADNAVRHTSAGRVTVFAEPEAAGITIGVRDTGVGIATEHLSRIFERFYRVDPGRAREQGGTGLGLSIVRHLVEAHGGRVSASSVVGQGSTIRCWLPARAPSRP